MNTLITGGAGFIGSHLTDYLLKKGDSVVIIDDLSTGRFENIIHNEKNSKFRYFIDTILNKEMMSNLIQASDRVFHLAAAVGVQFIVRNPLKTLEINIKGTETVLELANRYKKKVLITSTSEVYGKSESLPFSEDDDRVLGPTSTSRWSYSTSKAVDEYLTLAYYREKGLPIVISRLFNTCGPRQTGEYGMVVPNFVKMALMGQPVTIFGDGKQTRCFCDVRDIIGALSKLMDEPAAEGTIFNVGNDEEISIEDLAREIITMTDSTSPVEFIPYEKAYEKGFEDMRKRMPDLSRINNVIGYKPKYSTKDMLHSVIEYYKQ